MRPVLLLVLICWCTVGRGQYPYDYFNSQYFWDRMVRDYSDTTPSIQLDDTAIVLASIRNPVTSGYRFMAEESNSDSLRYFLVYSRNGVWRLYETPSLLAAIRLMPKLDNDWVVYTEGMGKVFPANVDRGMRLAVQYNVNVLFYDYPSIRSDYQAYKNYRFAVINSRNAHRGYQSLLDSLYRFRKMGEMGTGHLSLFFHSMGNNVIRELARKNLLEQYNDRVWIDNLILNAPCVPRRKHKHWLERIQFARKTYVHYNPEDGALKWARLASFQQVLGEHAKKPISSRATYINFNRLCGNGHSNFLHFEGFNTIEPEAINHYRTLLHGDTVILRNNTKYAPTEYRGVGWDILPSTYSTSKF